MIEEPFRKYILATDVGGTFTDTVVIAEGEPFHIGKSLSTPPNIAEGVLNSIKVAAQAMGLGVEELFQQATFSSTDRQWSTTPC